jgi:hypothetical protein
MLLLLHPTLQAYASLMVNATAYAYMYMYMGHQPVRNIQSGPWKLSALCAAHSLV